MQEFREDLTGYDHLQQLLTIAWVDNFPGQLRFCPADNGAAARLFTSGSGWRHALRTARFCTTTRSWPR